MNIASLSGVTKAVTALTVGGVLAGAIALGASGRSGGSSTPPAQVVSATATSVVEQSGMLAEPPTPRKDCPQNWVPYDDPDGRFSFCYPPDFKLVTDSRNDPRSFGVMAGVYPPKPVDGNVAVWFIWVAVAHTDLPAASVCAEGGGEFPFTSRLETTRTLAGATRDICFTDTFRESSKTQLDYRSLAAEFTVSDGGVVRVRSDYSASKLQEFEGIALQIVETLLVR